MSLDFEQTYVADAQGERYEVVEADVATPLDQDLREVIQPGVRQDHWLEFAAPKNGIAGDFTVGLGSIYFGSTVFAPFKVAVITGGN